MINDLGYMHNAKKKLNEVIEQVNTNTDAVAERVIKISSVFDPVFATLQEGDVVELVGYHEGTTVGGGSGVVKMARHDAITAFSVSKARPSDTSSQDQLTEWFTPDTELSLCFVRDSVQKIRGEMAGITGELDTGWTDDFQAVQACSNLATSLTTYTVLPKGDIFLSGNGLGKVYIETKSSIVGQGIGITRVQWEDLGSIDFSFEVVDGAAEYVTIGGMTIDNACSDDPVAWDSSNYDSFTGRRGIRSSGTRVNEVFMNIDIHNTVQAGLAWYGGAEKPFTSNVHSTRNRGNFGDCFYASGKKIGAKWFNISGKDFTRIGFVTDVPAGSYIKDVIVEKAHFENGHDQSFNYGGGEFNSGAWSERTLGISYIDCSAKDTGGRGFSGTTGGDTLGDSGDTFATFNYIRCSTDNCGTGFINETLGGVNAIHNLIDCSNKNNTAEDFVGTSRSENLTVNITRGRSDKSFSGPQSRVFGYASNASCSSQINIDTFHVDSDFDASAFDPAVASNGHFGVFSGVGAVHYKVSGMTDINGIAINIKSGERSNFEIRNSSEIYAYNTRCLDLTFEGCDVGRFDSNASPVNTLTISRGVSGGSFVTVAPFNKFSKVRFNVQDGGRLHLSNLYASQNTTNKIANEFVDCEIYKNFQGAYQGAIQVSLKADPYKNHTNFRNTFVYNTNTDGTGGYALYGDNGLSILGELYIDTTIQYASRVYATNNVNTAGETRVALQ